MDIIIEKKKFFQFSFFCQCFFFIFGAARKGKTFSFFFFFIHIDFLPHFHKFLLALLSHVQPLTYTHTHMQARIQCMNRKICHSVFLFCPLFFFLTFLLLLLLLIISFSTTDSYVIFLYQDWCEEECIQCINYIGIY